MYIKPIIHNDNVCEFADELLIRCNKLLAEIKDLPEPKTFWQWLWDGFTGKGWSI